MLMANASDAMSSRRAELSISANDAGFVDKGRARMQNIALARNLGDELPLGDGKKWLVSEPFGDGLCEHCLVRTKRCFAGPQVHELDGISAPRADRDHQRRGAEHPKWISPNHHTH
jgi:hypothetical protein